MRAFLNFEIMDNSWDKFESAPLEFFHSELMKLFHEYRKEQYNNDLTVPIDGMQLSNLIAKAKKITYEKYPGEEKARPKK